jgi:hypothetical protein
MAIDAPPRAMPVATLLAALLRTAAWLYGGLWVIVAATSPWSPPGLLPVVLLLPLAPLVMLASLGSLTGARRAPAARTPDPGLPARAHAFLSAPLTPPGAPPGRSAP